MAYYNIETRTLKSGERRYKTTVFVKIDGRIVHRESKTFKKKVLANSFGLHRIIEIEKEWINWLISWATQQVVSPIGLHIIRYSSNAAHLHSGWMKKLSRTGIARSRLDGRVAATLIVIQRLLLH